MEPGALSGTAFRPAGVGFFSLRSTVRLSATMCRSCGHIELSGDPEQLENRIRN